MGAPVGVAVERDADTALEDLGVTSLELVTVTFELEDAFGIVIKDQYFDDFRTVGEARDTVLALLAAAGRG